MMKQHMGWALAFFMGVASLFWPPVAGLSQALGDKHGVQEFRFGVEMVRTRLVLEMQGQVRHRWFTLKNPERVVVDFLSQEGEEIGFAQEPSKVKVPFGSRVTALRAGTFRPGVVRMVLDLKGASKVSVFMIPPRDGKGQRLVVDVMRLKTGEVATVVPPPQEVVTQVKDTGTWNPNWGRPGMAVAPEPRPFGVDETAQPVLPAPVVVPKGDGVIRIVLDPGHGGVDPGGCGRSLRLCEKHLVLDMAKRVRDALGRELNGRKLDVHFTRDKDFFIPLGERVRIAQRLNADVFVSLHADIAPDRSARGATVYMLSDKASDREAQRLADNENAGDDLAGLDLGEQAPEVRNILIDLVTRDTMNNSAYLGQSILNDMAAAIDVRKKHLLSAGFRVLKAPDIPSVLVEMGYLSNPLEERRLSDSAYRARLAKAIAKGLNNYVERHVFP